MNLQVHRVVLDYNHNMRVTGSYSKESAAQKTHLR